MSLTAQISPEPVQAANELKISVYISNATYSCETGIRFDWQIQNTSREKVYIYTPFLAGQAADLLEYDTSINTVLIPTATKSEASFAPYFYPEATFRPLAMEETVAGSFHEPISSQVSCKILRPKNIALEVAWGTDTSQVLTEISRIKKEGRVHPANPIVRWAHLARSAPIPIKYTEGR